MCWVTPRAVRTFLLQYGQACSLDIGFSVSSAVVATKMGENVKGNLKEKSSLANQSCGIADGFGKEGSD